MTDTATTPPDPFDPAKYRLSQDFVETCGVKRLRTTVPVHKPKKQDFVRVHPDPDYRASFPMLELKEERDRGLYLVNPGLADLLAGDLSHRTLFTAINRQGVVFFWPVPLPSADGRQNEWHRSLREAAERAIEIWLRVTANLDLGAYEIAVAEGLTAKPAWPEETFDDLIRIAFRDRSIDSFDHPVVKRLRGLA